MSSMSRIAIVTGANQGLGFALAEGLAQRLAPGDVVYLTGRDPARVRAAVARIARARARVAGELLDVRDGAAVTAFAGGIAARHGGVDIVFSNAAARLASATPWAELVSPFVETNNLGTTRILRALGPLLRPGGRLLSWPATSARSAGCRPICTRASTPMRSAWTTSTARCWPGATRSSKGAPTRRAGPTGSTSRPRWARSRRSASPRASAGPPTSATAS